MYVVDNIALMPTLLSYTYIYVSWTCLFAALVCVLKWISIQPNTQNSSDGDIVKSIQEAKIIVTTTKFLLFSSGISLILHFILS